MDSRFLIIARVGDDSQHTTWQQDEAPHFDLFVSYSGLEQDKFKQGSTFYDQAQGDPWPVLGELLESYWELISTYDAVWFPCDQLLTHSACINRLFHLFDGHQLALAQPAIAGEIDAAPQSLMRFVNAISPSAPLFSRSSLALVRSCFTEAGFSSPRHSPLLAKRWSTLIANENHNQFAIIDAAAMVKRERPAAFMDTAEIEFANDLKVYGQYIFNE